MLERGLHETDHRASAEATLAYSTPTRLYVHGVQDCVRRYKIDEHQSYLLSRERYDD